MTRIYQDPARTPQERARDLLADMTLEEKMAQVRCYLWQHGDEDEILKHGIGHVSTLEIRDVPSLEEAARAIAGIQKKVMENSPHHIPAIFHMEGLCGALIQEAVSFPSGIGRASSWDPGLEEEIGRIVGRQERAVGITQTLAPVLDISRDSRVGRQCETYGEDPALASAMGAAYTRGVQQSSQGRHTDACAKHFAGFHHSLGGIIGTDMESGERQLREIYAKPFQAAITESGLQGIMPSYNSINGKPASASKSLLTGLLREEMGFDGTVISDYSAIQNVHTLQRLYENEAQTGLASMEAGMDAELPAVYGYNEELKEWFGSGKADIAILDRAVYRLLCAKFRMGLFEAPYPLTGEALRQEFHQPEDEAASARSAEESLILLKNENQVLPLKKSVKKIALIGCHGKNARFFFGGYTHLSMVEAIHAAMNSLAGVDAANNKKVEMRTVPGTKVQDDETEEFDGILKRLHPDCPSLYEELCRRMPDTEIVYAYGYPKAGSDTSHFQEALEAARDADVILLTLGGKNGSGSIATMGEGVDSADINLPECQERFILEAARLGRPMVGIHLDGRPISSDAADRCLDAIVEAWNPSEKAAWAIVRMLLGEANPSGKLPLTVAYHAGQIPVFYNHANGSSWHLSGSIGFEDYVDLPHTPRYYFGHGLSYTTFSYEGLALSAAEAGPEDTVEIRCQVTNTGEMAGTEVVQLYLKDTFASMTRPVMELAGFARVELQPGETKTVSFRVSPDQLAFLDEEMRWKVEAGQVEVRIGSSSQNLPLAGSFRITEDRYIDGRKRGFYSLGVC